MKINTVFIRIPVLYQPLWRLWIICKFRWMEIAGRSELAYSSIWRRLQIQYTMIDFLTNCIGSEFAVIHLIGTELSSNMLTSIIFTAKHWSMMMPFRFRKVLHLGRCSFQSILMTFSKWTFTAKLFCMPTIFLLLMSRMMDMYWWFKRAQ